MEKRILIGVTIAATPIRDAIPKDQSLEERIKFAMEYALRNKQDLFWMSGTSDDDMIFRTAIAAVMMAGSPEDHDTITHSLKPLQALSALMSGVPVAFEDVDMTNVIPLMKMFHAAKETVKCG